MAPCLGKPEGSTLSLWMKPECSSVCSSSYRNVVGKKIQWVKSVPFHAPTCLVKCICLVRNVLLGTSSASVLAEALFLLHTEVNGYGMDVGIDRLYYWSTSVSLQLCSVIRPLIAECTNADKNTHCAGNYMERTMDARVPSWVKWKFTLPLKWSLRLIQIIRSH